MSAKPYPKRKYGKAIQQFYGGADRSDNNCTADVTHRPALSARRRYIRKGRDLADLLRVE